MTRFLTMPSGPGEPVSLRAYDPDDDDVATVLADMAIAWERAGTELVIHIPEEPLRTATDFGILLEQTPSAIRALETRQAFTFSMYEQTAMLDLDLVPAASRCRLVARPWRGQRARRTWYLPLSNVIDELRAAVVRVEHTTPHDPLVRAWIGAWRDGNLV